MTRCPTRAVAAALLIPFALASCGGGEKDEKAAPSSTTSKAAPSSSASKASPVSKPSSSSSTAGKGLMDPSPQGAVHLTRTYYQRHNAWGKNPAKRDLNALTESGCKSCAAFEGSLKYLHDHNQKYDRDMLFVEKVTAVFQSKGLTEVHFDMRQDKTNVVSTSGEHIETVPAANVRCVLFAKWTQTGWRVHEIQNVK